MVSKQSTINVECDPYESTNSTIDSHQFYRLRICQAVKQSQQCYDMAALLAAIENLEIQENYQRPRDRQGIYRNPFLTLSDRKFVKTFRLSKDLTRELINVLQPFVEQGHRVSAIPLEEKVLVALHFYATGSYQSAVGDNKSFALSQSSVSRCVDDITVALNSPGILSRFVKFPRNIDELNATRRRFSDTIKIYTWLPTIKCFSRFHNAFGMPGVVGCIDCTHVAIVPPKKRDPVAPEHIFVNRKQYHSINVQLICDIDMKILHANPKYPGSTHDSYIWNNSNIKEFLEQLFQRGYEGYFLLGDSGYPLRPWLITPLTNPVTEAEERFNEAQKKARCTIERCNGLLKMRFRCLLKHRTLHYSPNKASLIINACIVLHNMCIDNNVELLLDENEQQLEEFDFGLLPHIDDNENRNAQRNPLLREGMRLQRKLINHYR